MKSSSRLHFGVIAGKKLPSDTLRGLKPVEKSPLGHLPEAAGIVARPFDDHFQTKVVRKFPYHDHSQLKVVVVRKFYDVLSPVEADGRFSGKGICAVQRQEFPSVFEQKAILPDLPPPNRGLRQAWRQEEK